MGWEERIKRLLRHVVLYQLGRYPGARLERELDEFFKDSVKPLCEAVRRNGGLCLHEYLEDYPYGEALDLARSDARNFEMMGLPTMKMVADLVRLSIDLYRAPRMTLREKIMLFDRLIHAEHAAGAYRDEYGYSETSIFGVDIPRIKAEVDRELQAAMVKTPRPGYHVSEKKRGLRASL